MSPEQFAEFIAKNPKANVAVVSKPVPASTLAPVRTNLVLQKTTDEEKLNKLEARYLARLRTLGYPWIGVQNIALKLGHDCRLVIDFFIINQNGELEAHDTKARTKKGKILIEDDAQVKMAVAARLFPFIRFFLVTEDGGNWTKKPIKP